MAKLGKVLKTEISGDLEALAKLLQSKGRGRDTILAHITPEEAKRLKRDGGRGSVNPDTGLLEFDDGPDLGPITSLQSSPTWTPTETLPETQITSSAYTPTPSQYRSAGSFYLPTYGTDTGQQASAYAPTPEYTGTYQTGLTYHPTTQLPSLSETPRGAAATIDPNLVQQIAEQGARIEAGKTPIDEQTKYQKAIKALGGYGELARLGLTVGGGIMGRQQAIAANRQAQQYAAQQQALAQPYQAAGQGMVGAATRGELTPQSLQAYKAAQAQMAQAAESRGGVGAQQAATQLEAFRQQLLQNQYTYGLQVANIGDNIALGAIRTGMQADQYMANATQNFYATLLQFGVGSLFPSTTAGATKATP